MVALFALALVGCATPAVIPPAGPPSDEQPLFATDEEALAAATEAYEEFLAALDIALAVPDDSNEKLDEFAGGEVLNDARTAIDTFRDLGWRAVGVRQVVSSMLQQVVREAESTVVTIYVCESAEGVEVLDQSGESQVSEDRQDLTGFEVSVSFATVSDALIEDRAQWPAADVCDL